MSHLRQLERARRECPPLYYFFCAQVVIYEVIMHLMALMLGPVALGVGVYALATGEGRTGDAIAVVLFSVLGNCWFLYLVHHWYALLASDAK